MPKTSIQVLLCVFAVSSAVIAFYWIDAFMFPCGIALLVQAIPFILVAIYVPRLIWNLGVVFLHHVLLTMLEVTNLLISRQDWVRVGHILWNQKWSTAIVMIGVHVLFQLCLYFGLKKAAVIGD